MNIFIKKPKEIGCIAKKEKNNDENNMEIDESKSEKEESEECSDFVEKDLPSFQNIQIININVENDFNSIVSYFDKEFINFYIFKFEKSLIFSI